MMRAPHQVLQGHLSYKKKKKEEGAPVTWETFWKEKDKKGSSALQDPESVWWCKNLEEGWFIICEGA